MNTRINKLAVIIVSALILFMILDPDSSLEASRSGLKIWWESVFPALFPFLVACDVLIELGVAKWLGKLLNPIMRPVFRLPGSSGIVIAMGFTSGFPLGAVLTQRLFDEGLLTVSEAERLVCFTNNASPLFILGVVGASLFNSPGVGIVLAFSHYFSNLLIGILMALSSKSSSVPFERIERHDTLSNTQKRVDSGFLLGTAIRNSIMSILSIGGFIIVFSVVTTALSKSLILDGLSGLISLMGLTHSSGIGIVTGFFEMTLGAKSLAQGEGPLLERLLALSAVLAWSGISIQAQVISFVSKIPLRLSFYIKARLLQIILSVFLTWVGYSIFKPSIAALALSSHAWPSFSAISNLMATWLGLGLSLFILIFLFILSMIRKSPVFWHVP
ncbi:MAG: sporulation integral membrane protein YlbJ [Chitinophagales bacterium]